TAGWNDAVYTKNMDVIIRWARRGRLGAAGALFRSTGDKIYGDVVKNTWPFDLQGDIGAWEYANSQTADSATARAIKTALVDYVDRFIVSYSAGKVSYRNMKIKGANERFGTGGMNLDIAAPLTIRAHKISRSEKYLATMQAHLGHAHGANQYGVSFTSGIGIRN